MLKTIIFFYEQLKKMIEQGKTVAELKELPTWERIARMKYATEDKIEEVTKSIQEEIQNAVSVA